MIQVGDRVIYGTHGVCDIRETEEKVIDGKKVVYLVLEPLGQPGSRYLVPTHNEIVMGRLKKMLTRDEMEMLLMSDRVSRNCWIRDEGIRKQTYRELIGSGDREKLMAMLHTLYLHKAEQTAAGRKVHMCDDNFLRDAERILAGEVAAVMDLELEQAKQHIRSQLQK